MHGGFYAVARRHPAAGWVFWKVLFVQRRVACRRKSRASLARRARSRRQFRLALLLSSCVESDFCRCISSYGHGAAVPQTGGFLAASFDRCACRDSCSARRNTERAGVAHSCCRALGDFKKMQLTLDRRVVIFASKATARIAELVM